MSKKSNKKYIVLTKVHLREKFLFYFSSMPFTFLCSSFGIMDIMFVFLFLE